MDDNNLGVVAVTGASGQVGRALLRRLQGRARTIALTRQATELPADRVVVGQIDSPSAMMALMEADYVVHLAGALRPRQRDSYRAANLETAEAVSRVLREGKARRALFLSYVGASATAGNPYLRCKACAEHILAEHARELVVFRCTHIIGPPPAPGPLARALLVKTGGAVRILGDGRQIVAPIYLGDVVEALVAALRGGEPGTYELAGPQRMTLDELARLLNRDPNVPIRHCPAWFARLLGFVVPDLSGPLVDVLLRDSVGDATRAVAAFGLRLTPLSALWQGDEAGRPGGVRHPMASVA